jgi:hypothetical protein
MKLFITVHQGEILASIAHGLAGWAVQAPKKKEYIAIAKNAETTRILM